MLCTLLCTLFPLAHATELDATLASATAAVTADVIAWRRDFHAHPELSNREFRTAEKVARHLEALGLDEIHTKVAHTGVVGVLKGARPGPVVALRADMDALPVQEPAGLPFASTVTAEYNGQQVPAMHACGHDAHTAMLMGVASVLSSLRKELPGTVVFVFQPSEEGAPPGEEGGARLMLKEGLLKLAHQPSAIFGLHVWPAEAGTLGYRLRGTMAASDRLQIRVKGRQTHGSSPWAGVDPIIVSAEIMTALQLIPSRQLDVTKSPSVITIGSIHGGVRNNIIPDEVEMQGTLRNFDEGVRAEAHQRLTRTTEAIATAAGATAEVHIHEQTVVTWNDPELTRRMLPSLEKAAPGKVQEIPLIMAAEDFSYYQREIPGLFFFLGINEDGVAAGKAAANHSPLFKVNEAALGTGVHALAQLAVDYLSTP
ncbi:MAG: amidohydrolase [Gammaproteobacteria bacterium]|nr:amidohydrolase [Gammaproteobacteria bacterium]